MIFVNGYIHCDPHPGNVLIRKDANRETEIIMLDHGLYTVSLTPSFTSVNLTLYYSAID